MSTMYSDNYLYQLEITFINMKTRKAQTLVITLLVLGIIGIVVTGVIIISNRDVTQVVTNEKYEKLFNVAEQNIRDIIENNGISQLPQGGGENQIQCGTGQPFSGYIEYDCGIVTSTEENILVETKITITDRKAVNELILEKDRTFDILLKPISSTGYLGELQFRWSKPVAMEFNLIYQDSSGVMRSIRDVYDLAEVYDSLIGDDPYNDISNIHDINFEVLDNDNRETTTRFTIQNINGLNLGGTGTTLNLRVTPRSKVDNDVISLSIVAADESAFPFQIREFLASSRDVDDDNSPIANVVSKIPLNAQVDDIFDYSILLRSNLIQ